MMEAVKVNYRALEHGLNHLKESRAYMLSMALQFPMAFQFACVTLRRDAAYASPLSVGWNHCLYY